MVIFFTYYADTEAYAKTMTKFFTLPGEGTTALEPPIANVIENPRAPEEIMDGYSVAQLPPIDEAHRDALRAATGTLAMTGTKPAAEVYSPTVNVRNWRDFGSRQIPIGTVTMIGARKRGTPQS